MPKLQYPKKELASILGVGSINDMFVAVDNGQLVLRIDCTQNPAVQKQEEYKTVTAKGTKQKPKKQTRQSSREPETLADKFADKFGDWMKRNPKPPFLP